MGSLPECPVFRSDLEILCQAVSGRGDLYLVKAPGSAEVFRLTEKEMFICRQLDGGQTLQDVRSRFRDRFGLEIGVAKLKAFARQLSECGLLGTPGRWPHEPGRWESMKPVPVRTHGWISALARLNGWWFGWVGRLALLLLVVTAIGIVCMHSREILFAFRLFGNIIHLIGQRSGPSSHTWFRVALILVVIPFLREVCKAVACRHYVGPVPQMRYRWVMRLIPRIASDMGAVLGTEKKSLRLRTVCAGLECELLLLGVALLGHEIQAVDGPLKSFFFSLSLASAISFVINAIPLGATDGSMVLSVWLDIPDLRRRAVRAARALVMRHPAPEPLLSGDRRLFLTYGICADLYNTIFNVLVLWLVGYLLINWLEGVGGVLALVMLGLRFEDDIRRYTVGAFHFTRRIVRNWLIALGLVIVLVAVGMIPYRHEISAAFCVQPGFKRELRADIESQIESILAAEGERVAKGQLIATLSSRHIEKELVAAGASLKREESELQLLTEGAKEELIALEEQKVREAESILSHATREFERVRELYEKQHVSQQDHDAKLVKKDLAGQSLETARRQLTLARSGARLSEIAAQTAEVERLGYLVEHLEDDISRTRIVSPIDGRISTLFLQQKLGQRVVTGDVIAVVEETSRVMIRMAVPEAHAGDVRIGAPVRARFWAHSGEVFVGEVSAIAPIVIEKSKDTLQQASIEQEWGTVRSLGTPDDNIIPVLAGLPNDDGSLMSGMTGMARIGAGTTSLGRSVLGPVVRFFRVRVWSWLP